MFVYSAEADIITDMTIRDSSLDPKDRRVMISWKEPQNPNGIVIIYEVEYAKIDEGITQEVTVVPNSEDTIGVRLSSNRPRLVMLQITKLI